MHTKIWRIVAISFVTLSALWFTAPSAFSEVTPQLVCLSAPEIVGPTVAGNTVSANPGTWDQSGVSFTYQWYRNGIAIEGANATTLTIDWDTWGEPRYSFTVTAAKVGFLDKTETSGSRSAPYLANVRPPTVSGDPYVWSQLHGNPGLWASNVSLGFDWIVDGSSVWTGQDLLVSPPYFGKEIVFRVTGYATGFTNTVRSYTFGPIIRSPMVATGSPTISGELIVGSKLTLNLHEPDWSPAINNSYKIQWLRNGSSIVGATGQTYLLDKADAGKQISASVIIKPDYSVETILEVATTELIHGLPFQATGVPTFTGNKFVGVTLLGNAGIWETGTTIEWQWLVNGIRKGGNTNSYTLQPSDAGKNVSLQITGSKFGYETTIVKSLEESYVGLGSITLKSQPVISGNTSPGSYLTSNIGFWDASAQISYQWRRNGSPISGATQTSYRLTSEDIGHQIWLDVTGTKSGYYPAVETSNSINVKDIFSSNEVSIPNIRGEHFLNSQLTVEYSSPTWSTSTIQWLRDNVEIPNANSPSYVVTEEDLQHSLLVRLTVAAPGYVTRSEDSFTFPIQLRNFASNTVTVDSFVDAGTKIAVNTGIWEAGTSFTYQWFKDDVLVSNETESTFQTSESDALSRMKVKVVGSKPGYVSKTVTSNAAYVQYRTLTTPPISIIGNLKLNETVEIDVSAWPNETTFRYRWECNGTTVSVGSRTITIPASCVNENITAKVWGKIPNALEVFNQTPGRLVGQGTFESPTQIAINGEFTVGKTLSASVESQDWTLAPSGTTYKYQWLRNGREIPGATKNTFSVLAIEVNASISLRVTSANSLYAPVQKISQVGIVHYPAFRLTFPPTIVGLAQVGKTISAKAMDWQPLIQRKYWTWYRDDAIIAGATSSSYTLKTSDIGHTIRVALEGTRYGSRTESRISSATEPVLGFDFKNIPVPKIGGKQVIGSTLKAQLGVWPSNANYSYRWIVDGNQTGSTNSDLFLSPLYLGKIVYLEVTGFATNFNNKVMLSKGAGPIAKPVFENTNFCGVDSGVSSPQVGHTLTTQPKKWPTGTQLTYQWYRDSEPILGAKSKSYLVSPLDLGSVVTLASEATHPFYDALSCRSLRGGIVKLGTLKASSDVIFPKRSKIGQTLNYSGSNTSPVSDSTSFVWKRNGKEIDGETIFKYTLKTTDFNQKISLEIVFHKAGYKDLKIVSNLTIVEK